MISGMLSTALDRARPGIRFESRTPPQPEELPRMDIAAFIGFAERGPLHWPVAIEDMVQFEAVFGATPTLGWAMSGERIYGHLSESVRAFFIQGGQRCWVIRVASSAATSNVFPLPGLCLTNPVSGTIEPAFAMARSEGSWSDTLQVATRIQARAIMISKLSEIAPGKAWRLHTRSDLVRAGDLVRIVRKEGKELAFIPITAVERDAANNEIILHAKNVAAFAKRPLNELNKRTWGWEKIELDDPPSWIDDRAAIVSLDLRVRDQKPTYWRMENIGLTPLHPRYCGALPADIKVHSGSATRSGQTTPSVSTRPFVDLASWFPLAGIVQSDEGTDAKFLVPLEIDGNFGAECLAIAQESSALERDGLASFDASLFLDQSLRDARIAELMAIANDVRYSTPKPQSLQGIHAVLGWFGSVIQDEVSLIAVPDAVHAPWQGQPQPPKYSCVSEESSPHKIAEKPDTFACCHQLPVPADFSAHTTTPQGTKVRLAWAMQNAPLANNGTPIEYLVQEAATEEFAVADREWKTPETTLEIDITSPGRRFFRVQAHSGFENSPWSPAIVLHILEAASGIKPDGAPGAAAREIQRALIRLCAAQGELFPVLSLPKDITEQDAVNHVSALYAAEGQIAINPLNFDPEDRVGSFAAVYHPWLETRCTNGIVRPLPPDGAVLGMLAARTRDHGAWVAPANKSLRGVVALHTTLPSARQVLLSGAGINLVLQRPEGYTLLSEDTLSSVPDLRPIHVRRLLILLRRMVLRMGEEFTFEPNDQILRELIRQRCYSMLERMFKSGAFDGRSPAEAFQVSVNDADNPQASMDAGRLVVRIRVRPAQALRFITIRFTLGGGATGVTEENAA